jgi:hypothetical protein
VTYPCWGASGDLDRQQHLWRHLPRERNGLSETQPSPTRTITGVSLLWLGLAKLLGGIDTLVLPAQLVEHMATARATLLGTVTFAGIGMGMIAQSIIGSWSDSARASFGRLGPLSLAAATWTDPRRTNGDERRREIA